MEFQPSPEREVVGWTIESAETLLASLKGVVSVRLVCRPGGEVEEIHLLTDREVSPKQTVRNVESALLAHYGLRLDHRKISVAQSTGVEGAKPRNAPEPQLKPVAPVFTPDAGDDGAGRIVFLGHQVASEASHRVRIGVELGWDGGRYRGETVGADLPRSRLEALVTAALQAIESVMRNKGQAEGWDPPALAMDGVKVVEAFERPFVLVAVHALHGRSITPLSGAAAVDESPERAAVLATLQATDRWVRGRLKP